MSTHRTHIPDTVDEQAWQEQERVWRDVREGRPVVPEDAGDAAIYAALAMPPGGPGEDFAARVAAQAERIALRRRQVRRFRFTVLALLVPIYACAAAAGLLFGGPAWMQVVLRAGSVLGQGGWLAAALACVALFAVIEPLTRGAPPRTRG